MALDLPQAPLFIEDSKENIIPQIPISQLLSKYLGTTIPGRSELKRYRIKRLPKYLIFTIKRFSINNFKEAEKNRTIINFPLKGLEFSGERFRLLANIYHEGSEAEGTYKIHVSYSATGQWLLIQDLFVDEVMAQMVSLSESHIQIWGKE